MHRLIPFHPDPFTAVPFQLAPADPILGSKLTIELTPRPCKSGFAIVLPPRRRAAMA